MTNSDNNLWLMLTVASLENNYGHAEIIYPYLHYTYHLRIIQCLQNFQTGVTEAKRIAMPKALTNDRGVILDELLVHVLL